MVLGRFDYDRRGILDAGHIRFFTRASFDRLARRAGMEVRRVQPVGVPQEVLIRGGRDGAAPSKALVAIDRASDVAGALWPTLFAYQFLFELASDPRRP